jgi:hypothetical protein
MREEFNLNSIPFLPPQCYDRSWGGFKIAACPFIRWNIEVVFPDSYGDRSLSL